jgi:Xaa-Pro dipeptidase
MNAPAYVPLTASFRDAELYRERQSRLRAVMRSRGIPAVLTADPINISYGCGARNMTVFAMMGPSRFLLLFAEGPSILFEFAGSEHLAAGLVGTTVDEVRPAPAITALAGPQYLGLLAAFSTEIAGLCAAKVGAGAVLAVERLDWMITDALRADGLVLADATAVFSEARKLKRPSELVAMREAIGLVQEAVAEMRKAIVPGSSEVEIWAEFHRGLIARNGEYVSTRLMQSGPNTFPYFQEAGSRRVQTGELICLDTDAIGYRGYAVDFSRTYVCGDRSPTDVQRRLHREAREQLEHNAALLHAGRSFEDLARLAWTVPAAAKPYGYYCVAHGLGLCGEYPNVPLYGEDKPYPLDGELEADMVVCIESYIGDPVTREGVKLEDQYLITSSGAERLSTAPFDEQFG